MKMNLSAVDQNSYKRKVPNKIRDSSRVACLSAVLGG